MVQPGRASSSRAPPVSLDPPPPTRRRSGRTRASPAHHPRKPGRSDRGPRARPHHHHRHRPDRRVHRRVRRPAAAPAGHRRLPRRRRAHRPVHPGLRRRPGHRHRAGRARRDPAHVRRRASTSRSATCWPCGRSRSPGRVGQIARGHAARRRRSGWRSAGGSVAGSCSGWRVSVASTVVLLRALMDRGDLDTAQGRIAVGWLIVEDLVTVLVLVLLPTVAPLLGGTVDDHGAIEPRAARRARSWPSARRRSSRCSWSSPAPGSCRGCSTRSPARARASCSPWPCWPSPWASPTSRRRSSACRSRSARSWPAPSSASRT